MKYVYVFIVIFTFFTNNVLALSNETSTILVYQRFNDPWYGDLKDTYTWKNKTTVKVTPEIRESYKIYPFTSDFHIFDEKSQTLLVELPTYDFELKIQSDINNKREGEVWISEYSQPAPKDLPCQSYFIMKSEMKIVDTKDFALIINGDKKTIKVLQIKDDGKWSHCGPVGAFSTNFSYSPELKLIVSVEFVIFRNGSIRRGVKTDLIEIKN